MQPVRCTGRQGDIMERQMKRRTKLVVGMVVSIGMVSAGGIAVLPDRDTAAVQAQTFEVSRGSVVERAMASGTIEPSTEVEVKSKVSGVVRQLYTDAGQYVEAGTPLVEIRPDPTPLELVDARRQLELRQMELEAATRELDRQRALQQTGAVTGLEVERSERHVEQLALQVTIAREKLALLEGGRVTVGDRPLESVITAPISGFILERIVQVGQMVSPLSSFQSGTVLFKMANMNELVFRGTVDEIDVGRLRAGAEVAILIGALPDVRMSGRVTRISLRSTRTDQSVGFPVEIAITDLDGAVLRAGYSASAEITVRRADDALLIPERLISWAGDTATVTVQKTDGTTERRVIRTGVSDAVNVQVISGLAEGDRVLERPAATRASR
ncbi:MAG TPA: efflux RND transporter periplasmic adaptor subunit [Longimicrobiales bacterium]|nr:efflux RND transporter periplasmic adaptor subunit [Longimicrobiales bacterium]